MPDRIPPPRPLRRLRRLLALLGLVAVALIAAACRLQGGARAASAVAAVFCVVGWLVLLEAEGRAVDAMERRSRRRTAVGRATRRPVRGCDPHRAMPGKQTARSGDRAV